MSRDDSNPADPATAEPEEARTKKTARPRIQPGDGLAAGGTQPATVKVDNLKQRIRGSILGHLVGDARGHRQESLNQNPGVYTDRGSMLLCTIASINEADGIDQVDLMDKLRDFYVGGYMTSEGECFQISTATSQAIKNYSLGMPPDRCGVKGSDSIENDALARILPVALFCASLSTDEITKMAHQVSAMTHNNLITQVCCALYSLLIRSLLLQKGEKVFRILETHYNDSQMKDYSSTLAEIRNWVTDKKPAGTSLVIDSFWSAWQAYANHQTDFQHCMNACFKYGNNCGATACLAGGLTGLALGINDIPEAWMRELKIDAEATSEIDRFVERSIRQIF